MAVATRIKILLLIVGDVLALYGALFLTLSIRYGADFYTQFVDTHAVPFGYLFLVWLLIFFVAGLYDLRRLHNNLDFLKTLSLTIGTASVVSFLFFYLTPTGITPRRTLLIFIVVYTILEFVWRRAFNRSVHRGEAPYRMVLLGNDALATTLHQTLKENPQLGYHVVSWLKDENDLRTLSVRIREEHINLVVIPRHFKKSAELTKSLYALLESGLLIRDIPGFYELIFQKIPLTNLEESWFLEHLQGEQRFYDQLKQAAEIVMALALGLLLVPLELLITLLVVLTSRGPLIYKQVRIGKNGKSFVLYKFRTMRIDAEKNGAQWSPKNDTRVTMVGKLLRYTHLDELPQLINIIRGDLAFVGPRPERPEFSKLLAEKIPYYEIRTLVKPGITGWAQINYRYGASVEDAYQKLEYDIYYIKNRSLPLDIITALKTIKSFFVHHE